jgi:hypothetical protein
LPGTSEAMIRMAMIHVMVRRLEPTRQNTLASQKQGLRPRRLPKFPNSLSEPVNQNRFP